MVTEITVTIKNSLGIHARPAALFVKVAAQFKSNITVSRDGMDVNGKSIMGILMLAAEQGARLIVRVEGDDSDEARDAIVDLIERRTFDEE